MKDIQATGVERSLNLKDIGDADASVKLQVLK